MARIYLSSTYSDLKEPREAVYRVLRRMQHDAIAMENYGATDQRPLDKCLADVASCDLYIGIFAWRYGFVPPEDNPQQKSITELEYRKARECGKDCLIFLLDQNAAWPPSALDAVTGEGERGRQITRLRDELALQTTVNFFRSAEELAGLVGAAVGNWERGQNSFDPLTLLRVKYLEKVERLYGSVILPIGPVEGVSLHAIIQPLALRHDPLDVESLEHGRPLMIAGEELAGTAALQQGKPARAPIIAKQGADALRKSPQGRAVILGGAGTGKTTMLKHLVANQARKALNDPNEFTPIFLSLADFARSGKTLPHYLIDLVEGMGIEGRYAETLSDEIQAGHAFIALDSLDEVAPGERTRMSEFINNITSDPGNIWLVGSRFTEYKGGQFKRGQFSEWELLPLTAELRRALAERLFPELARLLALSPNMEARALPTTFVRRLEEHPQAASWGENPLLFSLAAVVYVQTGDLPSSRAKLYHDVIDAVLSMREKSTISSRYLLRILSGFALWQHGRKGRTFSGDDLFSFLESIQLRGEEAEKIAERIIRSGILDSSAHDTYGFRHQTFQEYLAGLELAKRLAGPDKETREATWHFAWSKRTYSFWKEVLRLMVGALAQLPERKGRAEAIRWITALLALRTSAEADPGELGLALALKSLAEVTEMEDAETAEANKIALLEQRAAEDWANALLNIVEQRPYIKLRRLENLASEISCLRKGGMARTLVRMLAALHAPNRNIRESAVRALQLWGEHIPLAQLLPLLEDQDKHVREAIIRVLGGQGGQVPLETFLYYLKDPDKELRVAAVTALQFQGERVSTEIFAQLLHDKEKTVREAAILALARRKATALLLPMLHDPASEVRQTTIRALRNFGADTPIGPLARMLRDPDRDVIQEAIWALEEHAQDVPAEAWEPVFQHNDKYLKASAIRSGGYKVPFERHRVWLTDADWLIRAAAVRALGAREEAIPEEAILNYLHDPYASIRQASIDVFKIRKAEFSVETILTYLEIPDQAVKDLAAQILQATRENMPLETWTGLLEDPAPEVRKVAFSMPGFYGEAAPLAPLLGALHDPDRDVRKAAIRSLGQLRDHIPDIFSRLDTTDEDVHCEAIMAFRLGIPEATLLALLDSPAPRLKTAVIGVLGGRIAAEKLHTLLRDDHVDVRKMMIMRGWKKIPPATRLELLDDPHKEIRATVINLLGEQLSIELCMKFLNDTSRRVRMAAIRALGRHNDVPLDTFMELLQTRRDYKIIAAADALEMRGENVPTETYLELFQNPPLHDPGRYTQAVALRVLEKRGMGIAQAKLQDLLTGNDRYIRAAALEIWAARAGVVPLELLVASSGDLLPLVRQKALDILREQAPEALLALLPEALDILRGRVTGRVLASPVYSHEASMLGNLGLAAPEVYRRLTEFLDWPYWQTRVEAIEAIHKLRRGVPETTIQRLLALSHNTDPLMARVREAADDALADILALEDGTEEL